VGLSITKKGDIMGTGLTVFEAIMLVCFGASWPFAIARTLRTKSVTGASATFHILVLLGYVSGIVHKIHYNMNFVLGFYVLNACMVALQLALLSVYRSRQAAYGTRETVCSTPPLGMTETIRLADRLVTNSDEVPSGVSNGELSSSGVSDSDVVPSGVSNGELASSGVSDSDVVPSGVSNSELASSGVSKIGTVSTASSARQDQRSLQACSSRR
jgi:hypothetical protein